MDYGEFSLLRTGTTMEVTIKNAMEIKKDIGMKEMFRTVSSLTDQRLDKATSKGIFYNAGRPEDPANSQLFYISSTWTEILVNAIAIKTNLDSHQGFRQYLLAD